MRSPRSVTMAPIGMPSRTLNAAIDFFAFVTTGFCPVIWPSSLTAGSMIFAFCVASPTPILTTILFSRGTAIGFLRSSSLASATATSFSKRTRSRGRSFAECRGASGPALGSSAAARFSPFAGFPFFCSSLFCPSFAMFLLPSLIPRFRSGYRFVRYFVILQSGNFAISNSSGVSNYTLPDCSITKSTCPASFRTSCTRAPCARPVPRARCAPGRRSGRPARRSRAKPGAPARRCRP